MSEGPWKLPKGWRWVRLGEVAVRDTVTINPSSEPSRLFNYVGLEHISNGQWEEPPENLVQGLEIKSACIIFKPGQVLYSKLRPYLNKVVICSRDGIASTEFIPLSVVSALINPAYLAWYLRSPEFVSYANSHTTGSRQPRVKKEAFWSALIPLPPLSEQHRIVARIEELFDRIREARRLREEAQKDAETLLQSAMAEVFPRPGIPLPLGWKWVKLGEVCEYKSGIWGPEAKVPMDGFPIVRSTEIAGHRIEPQSASIRSVPTDKAQCYALQSGDILVNKSSGSPHLVGWPAIFEDPGDGRIYLFSNFMLRLRIDKSRIDPWFMLYYLHSPMARANYLGAQDTTSGLRNLRVRDFIAQPIPLLSLPEQRRIVAYLDQVQAQTTALKGAQEATDAELHRLEQAILDKAFRGEL